MYKFNKPTFLVYLGKRSIKKKPEAEDIVFTKVTSLKDFKKYKTLYRKSGVYLIRVER